ncbi:Predicted ATP-dependent carboligase, ATP-grasp superfamily [Neorhodopirellula lusitana]|uniref:Predicted ATP-dependent carboligase, ATP-grasp superfamily n=1 Tax=Neorhodopirellula lusitana TaxID=445327 RepID=A0ABY1Q8T5_9BACT|nr:ATP-grasp domain-containing protein [Neorhodopirellula lusitana]SMP63357.1 Predicted ATP-dependent carboligase, ATP-grasp superfamily [Neorhodopirellula lusitana]
MKIFVAEYLCGGGMYDTPVDTIPPSLLREGTAMLRSIVDDLSRWADVCTPVDPRLPHLIDELNQGAIAQRWEGASGEAGGDLASVIASEGNVAVQESGSVQTITMKEDASPLAAWVEAALQCDATIVVVPETDQLLTKVVTMMRGAGVHVLAPSNAVIATMSDKWQTAKWLHREGIPHPDAWSLDVKRAKPVASRIVTTLTQPPTPNSCGDQCWVKPRDGCGAMGIRSYHDLRAALDAMQPHEFVQRHVPGRPASVLVMGCEADRSYALLPAVWQCIDQDAAKGSDEGCLVSGGGIGPVPESLQCRAHALAARVIDSLPGKLGGFVGIDMVLGDNARHDSVIEVNARLTTSYLGVRQMVHENLSRRLFEPVLSRPEVMVADEAIQWSA